MKPFKIIEQQKKVIDNLKYKLEYSKNKVKDAEDINDLIKTVNCLDSMLVSKYKTDAIDVLIIYILNDFMMRYSTQGNFKDGLPIHQFLDKLNFKLDWSSNLSINSVSKELQMYILQGNIENNKKNILDLPSVENIETLVKDLLFEIKQNIVWKR
jgi:hypothetical protein